MNITNEQWNLVSPLIPPSPRKDGRGRPRQDDRAVLDGILWVLRTGAQWSELPKGEYPPYQTCHRRFQEWVRKRVFERILTTLAKDMESRGKINLQECFIDGTFASAKKGGSVLAKRNEVRAQRSWLSQTLQVFLSLPTWILLLHMRSPWWQKRLPRDLPERIRRGLWLTGHTTPIPWTSSFAKETLILSRRIK